MKQRIRPIFIIIVILGAMGSGCNDFLEPRLDNRYTLEDVKSNPALAEGWLLKAYNGLPTNYNFNEDIASDDAVTNVQGSNIISMNSGGWNASFNPIGIWEQAYEMNLYLNTFLQFVDEIEWSWRSTEKDSLYRVRLKAEAYGMRAWWNYLLLQKHGGIGANGSLLGFPIVKQVLGAEDEQQLPRNTYAECVQYILEDCDSAIVGLPLNWKDIKNNDLHNDVLGERYLNRINGLAVLLLKSRVALTAASPAFSGESGVTWAQAAKYAANVMAANGGLSSLKPADSEFYLDYEAKEVFWHSRKTDNTNGWESSNLPPSLFGDGQINPSQNLVETFPMANGVPINNPVGGFDAANPYADRDPRLAKYVIFDGNYIYATEEDTAYVGTYLGAELDGINAGITATRTGYYLKKFMNPQVRLDPSGTIVGAEHFYTYARYTEALLNYAEAANEAWGPDADPQGYGFTARDVISAIRVRGGLPEFELDTYLRFFVPGKANVREVVKNERRIELCFEGFRFWDIRRWGMTSIMAEDVKGMEISTDQTTYTPVTVEGRKYAPHNIYGPIPYIETLKYDLEQNQGYE